MADLVSLPRRASASSAEPRTAELQRIELAALRTVAQAVGEGLSLEATIQFCLDETLRHLGLDFGSLYLRRHDYLIRLATHGLMVPGGPEGILPLDDVRWACRPLLVSQGAETDLGHLPAGVAGKSWMSLPLMVSGDLVGVMIVGGWGRLPSELPPLETALRVSGHIAAAVDNACRFERLRGILNDTRDVIFRTDVAGRFTVLNDAWQETMGEPVVVALGKRFADYVVAEQRSCLGEGVHFVVPRGCVIGRRTLAFATADGNTRHLDVLARLITDDRGRLAGTAGVLRDVTRTVRQERALAAANDQLRQRAEELETANRELAEADRLKSEFLANVSHELRTPLGIMLGYAEMLSDGLPDTATPGQLEYLHAICQAGEGLGEMIQCVLDLACLEAGRVAIQPEAVSLAACAEHVRGRLARKAAAAAVAVTVEVDPRAGAWADGERLEQVLEILVDNAIKFSRPGDEVLLTAGLAADDEPTAADEAAVDDPRYAVLRVIDSGIGLRPEQRAGLFEKFRQGDGSVTRAHGGLGLGLVVARLLVERMGGRVDLFSDGPGRGAQAVLVLPLP